MNRTAKIVVVLFVSVISSGCAPKSFGPAVAYYAKQHRVRDAAARRVTGYCFLRFDELTISDLDDAIKAGRRGDTNRMRQLSEQVLRAAGSLAISSAAAEIDRLPEPGRRKLAALGNTAPDATHLNDVYATQSRRALGELLVRQAAQSDADALRELQRIRRNIEAAPDDKGRLARQLTLAWAAAPAWIGLSRVEASHEAEQPPLKPGVFDRAAIWELAEDKLDGDIARHAPAIVIEWPDHRDYPDNYDRFGEVYLMGSPDDVHVGVNPSRPIIYTYRSEAKIRGRRYPQFVYAWWFPERPAMSNNDPAAGHIDGDTLRITLGSDGRPAIFEVTQSCGCGHVVFVADHVEEQARKQFGKPLSGKNLSVERDVAGKRDLIVSGSVPVADESVRPIVYILAGFHGVRDVQCAKPSEPINDVEAVERHAYDLCPYDKLDRLPFGDRYASMFGPDGLVHNAGRAEGFLLAPTGIMSAGQPRKRGTQKIRWDDYSFDDPSLLEKTLRLPDAF